MAASIFALVVALLKAVPSLLGFIERASQAAREAEADKRLDEKLQRITDRVRSARGLRDDAEAGRGSAVDGSTGLSEGGGNESGVGKRSAADNSKT